MEDVHSRSYTRPVGEPISPDGIHYIFTVGEEEMLISKSYYENLPHDNTVYGTITEDNKLIIIDQPTSMLVQKTKTGLSVNSFAYPLKRDSALISGDVCDMMNDVTNGIDDLEVALKELINNNIFIPPYHRYASLRNAFKNIKNQVVRKRR